MLGYLTELSYCFRLMIMCFVCHTCMRAEFEGKLRTARKKDPAFVIDAWLL